MITWVREVKGETEVVSRDDFLAVEHNRYTLDIDAIRPGNTSKYDLIIADTQLSDAGTYHCMLRNRKGGGQGVSHTLSLTVAESPKFGKWLTVAYSLVPEMYKCITELSHIVTSTC